MTDPLLQQSGVLLVDKPTDWTSHDVVKFVRRFGIKKVGHCGTLDPNATGLLVLVLGRATKLSQRFSGQKKTYEGCMELGKTTTSQDAQGDLVEERDWSHVTETQVHEIMSEFVGDIMQVPPMVSALKRGGRKLYELARKGIEVEREPRPVTIHELDLQNVTLPEVRFRVHCSKGTYVRTLCADVGERLGCGAHLKTLRRTASGIFTVDKAFPMEDIKTWNADDLYENFIPLEQAVNYL